LLRVEADAKAKGKYNLHFTDDSVETGVDLIVGADGAWLKVRPLVTTKNLSIPTSLLSNYWPWMSTSAIRSITSELWSWKILLADRMIY
jgi:hypothetical protein